MGAPTLPLGGPLTYLSKPPALGRKAANHFTGWPPSQITAAPALKPLQGGRRHLIVQAVGQVPQDTHGVLYALRDTVSEQFRPTSIPASPTPDPHLVLALAHVQGMVDVSDQGVH